MTENFCSKDQINAVAGALNAGDRETALREINICTTNLVKGSDYAKDSPVTFPLMMLGDKQATQAAETSFAKLANDERQLWQSMSTAAQNKTPNGLCQLTIVEDKDQGPHAEINGAQCH
jgi:hypothetical protein